MVKLKKFAFVLMPFDKSFDDIYAYGIKQTCTDLNIYCERVDEQIFTERILDRIYNQISKADIVIADMSTKNSNVFYEVGYAHGLGKNVILLTQNSDDIPFDLKHFPHIIYNGQIKILSDQLKIKLQWFTNDKTSPDIDSFDFNLDFLINGQRIVNGAQIEITKDLKNYLYDYFDVQLNVFNTSSKIHSSKFIIGLETSFENKECFAGIASIKPSPEKVLFASKELNNIFPNAYKSLEYRIKQPRDRQKSLSLTLKIFTVLELREINFSLVFPKQEEFDF